MLCLSFTIWHPNDIMAAHIVGLQPLRRVRTDALPPCCAAPPPRCSFCFRSSFESSSTCWPTSSPCLLLPCQALWRHRALLLLPRQGSSPSPLLWLRLLHTRAATGSRMPALAEHVALLALGAASRCPPCVPAKRNYSPARSDTGVRLPGRHVPCPSILVATAQLSLTMPYPAEDVLLDNVLLQDRHAASGGVTVDTTKLQASAHAAPTLCAAAARGLVSVHSESAVVFAVCAPRSYRQDAREPVEESFPAACQAPSHEGPVLCKAVLAGLICHRSHPLHRRSQELALDVCNNTNVAVQRMAPAFMAGGGGEVPHRQRPPGRSLSALLGRACASAAGLSLRADASTNYGGRPVSPQMLTWRQQPWHRLSQS